MNRDLRNGLILAGGIGALATLVLCSKNTPDLPIEDTSLPQSVPLHRVAVPPGNGEYKTPSPEELELILMKSYDGQPIRDERKEDILSNGMEITNYPVRGVLETDWGNVYIMNTGYPSPDYDARIFDLGDGNPFVFSEVYKKDENGFELWDSEKGGRVLDHIERSHDLTYRFCNEPHGPFRDGTYPIWDPTAFRSDPCYGKIGPIKKGNSD